MKLARLQIGERQTIAMQMENGIYDISDVRDFNGSDIVSFLASPNAQIDGLYTDLSKLPNSKTIDVTSAKFLPPVARPGKIICLGLNPPSAACLT